jgi:hypothetical protein
MGNSVMQSCALLALLALAACQSAGTSSGAADEPRELRPMLVGLEAQVYPTGVMVGPRTEIKLNDTDAFHARFALHWADRGDAGEHDDEEGDGWGVGFGWRRWLESYGAGWAFGTRLDYWRLDLDWADDGPPPREGSTEVGVLVPSLEGAYSWPIRRGRFDLTAGLGYEFNIDTDGEDVGEGAILMIGVSFSGG